MVEQLPYGDPFGRQVVGDAELRQVAAYRPVEVDGALIDQLHDQSAGPELGHRPDLEDRIRGRLDPGRLAGQPGRSVGHLVALENSPPRARNIVLLKQPGKPLIEPRLNVV